MKLTLDSFFVSGLVFAGICVAAAGARGEVLTFFDNTQGQNLINSGTVSNTIASHGYIFEYSQDKLFTGGVGMVTPIGRNNVVSWPNGLHAQAITTGPTAGDKAYVTITREDGGTFDILSFTAKLLANTSPPGAEFEVVPKLDGEEILDDPVFFDATGYYSQNFTYTRTPSPYLGQSTLPLTGYDSYKIGLWVDFGLMSLTVDGAPTVPEPSSAMAIACAGLLVSRRVRHRGPNVRDACRA